MSFKGKIAELNWEFDAKDSNFKKYGNFSTSTLLKLVSKYQKSKLNVEGEKVDANKIAEIVVEELNNRLKSFE